MSEGSKKDFWTHLINTKQQVNDIYYLEKIRDERTEIEMSALIQYFNQLSPNIKQNYLKCEEYENFSVHIWNFLIYFFEYWMSNFSENFREITELLIIKKIQDLLKDFIENENFANTISEIIEKEYETLGAETNFCNLEMLKNFQNKQKKDFLRAVRRKHLGKKYFDEARAQFFDKHKKEEDIEKLECFIKLKNKCKEFTYKNENELA